MSNSLGTGVHTHRVSSLVILAASMLFAFSICAKPNTAEGEHFSSIFNGKNLDGWDGDPAVWSVVDGAITGRTAENSSVKENVFLIWRGGQPEDFELRASVRLVPQNDKGFANSGIYYRSRLDAASGQVLGYQADMDASLPEYLGALYEDERTTLAKCGQQVVASRSNGKATMKVTGTTASTGEISKLFSELKAGHWLSYRIIATGNHLRHYVNGVLTVDVTDEDDRRGKAGVIALQVHHGGAMLVQFKNIDMARR